VGYTLGTLEMPGIYGRKQFYLSLPLTSSLPSTPSILAMHTASKLNWTASSPDDDMYRNYLKHRPKDTSMSSPNIPTVSLRSESWKRYWYHLTTITGMTIRHYDLDVLFSPLDHPVFSSLSSPSTIHQILNRRPCHSRTNS
jgi:hypothetical protein